ncbi:MAG: hypothetical protein WC279_01010 [Sulfurimonas sp.]|jgi:hypothetical protein|uniref:hypothetical protein n=1 Tax=Sulfurimonas sp. TaxID=2022749 RepID=UPI00356547CE
MSFDEALQFFFFNYCKFINIDLTVSLLNKNDRYHGRNIDIVIIFQDTLIWLLQTKDADESSIEKDRQDAIKKLATTLKSFLDPHMTENTHLSCHEDIMLKLEANKYCIQRLCQKDFVNIFKIYYTSYRDFVQFIKHINIDDETRDKFQLNNQKESILVQAMLEINNAFAHIMVAILNDDNDALNNIDKAINHVYRASLDHYKMLIRLIYTDSSKTIKTNITDAFKQLRFEEFRLLGTNIDKKHFLNSDKESNSILNSYKEMFNMMMQN